MSLGTFRDAFVAGECQSDDCGLAFFGDMGPSSGLMRRCTRSHFDIPAFRKIESARPTQPASPLGEAIGEREAVGHEDFFNPGWK